MGNPMTITRSNWHSGKLETGNRMQLTIINSGLRFLQLTPDTISIFVLIYRAN